MSYLGFIAPAAAAPIAAATGPLAPLTYAALSLVSFIPKILPEIGAGRKEADAITAEVLPAFNRSIAQAEQYLAMPLTAAELRELYAWVQNTWNAYESFLYQETFTADGDTRASDQAYSGDYPRVADLLTRIQKAILATGAASAAIPRTVQSGVPRLSMPGSGISSTVQPVGLFQNPAVNMSPGLPSAENNNLLLWAGLGLLALAVSKG